jgi:hypothetical protein
MPLPTFPRGAAQAAVMASLAALVGPPLVAPAPAQSEDPFRGVRAINLARNHAVQLNGGLSLYRPAACMFSTDARGEDCLVRRDESGFLFRFLGGSPGWQQLNLPPTTETEILIGTDGRSVVEVVYNGPPRDGTGSGAAAVDDTTVPADSEAMPDASGPDFGADAPAPPDTGTD